MGLLHIYCGDGKGKSTAAVGLSVRAAGAGKKVIFTQFFKDGSSSEIGVLKELKNIKTLNVKENLGFYKNMDAKQKLRAAELYTELFERALKEAENAELMVLDEIISCCNYGIVDEKRLLDFICGRPEKLEIVLTGRNPSEKLLEAADYVTEMKKIKHPYDRGVKARKGIEF